MPLDLDKPIQTRVGRAVRLLCRDSRSATGPLAVLISEANGQEILRSYKLDGRAFIPASHRRAGRTDSAYDLINVPRLVKRWKVTFLPDAELSRVPAYYTNWRGVSDAHLAHMGDLDATVLSIELVEIAEAELPA